MGERRVPICDQVGSRCPKTTEDGLSRAMVDTTNPASSEYQLHRSAGLSGRIDEVHLGSERAEFDDNSKFNRGSLQALMLDMLSLLAVSADKHVLLRADEQCTRSTLSIGGSSIDGVKVALDMVSLCFRPGQDELLRIIPLVGRACANLCGDQACPLPAWWRNHHLQRGCPSPSTVQRVLPSSLSGHKATVLGSN